jgi:predicted DNA-binding transcriptional regulator AlpA
MSPEAKRDARERRIKDALTNFNELPDDAILRVGPVARVVGCGPATIWRHAKLRIFPTPVKVSAGITGWRAGDIRKYLADPQAWARLAKVPA